MSRTVAQLEGLLRRANKEIARCHARLEIDHYWQMSSKGAGKMKRVKIPYKDRLRLPDGISCRDETIKILDRRLKRLGK